MRTYKNSQRIKWAYQVKDLQPNGQASSVIDSPTDLFGPDSVFDDVIEGVSENIMLDAPKHEKFSLSDQVSFYSKLKDTIYYYYSGTLISPQKV